jgi:hypothetical protein
MRSSRLQTCLFFLAGILIAEETIGHGSEEKAAFPRVWVSTTEIEAIQPKSAPVQPVHGTRLPAILEKGRLRMRRVPKKPNAAQEKRPQGQERGQLGAKIRLQHQPDIMPEPVYDLSEMPIQDDEVEAIEEPNPRITYRQQTDMLFVPFPYYMPPAQGDYEDVSLDELDDDWMVVKRPEPIQPKLPIVIARCPQMML